MSEFLVSLDTIEAEIKKGKSLILVEPVRDTRFNVLIGTEKILTEKDIQKIRERCPEWISKPILVRTAIPHYIEEEKRIKWSAYVISLFQNDARYRELSRDKKDFVNKYLKAVLMESDYLVWKLSIIKGFSKKVFDHTLGTTFISLILHYSYSQTKLSGMIDGKMVEKIISVALLHTLGLLKADPALLDKKRVEISQNREHPFYQYPIESYKAIQADHCRHELTEDILEAVLNHEELLDGSGGPRGVKGDDLSILTRTVSLAGYFDLLLSGEWSIKERPYREYIAKMRQEKGKFDPEMVEALDLAFKYLYQY